MTSRTLLRQYLALSVLFLIAVSGCASNGTNSPPGQTTFTPVVVRILNLDAGNLSTEAAQESRSTATQTVVALLPPTNTPSVNLSETSPGAASPTPSCTNKAELISHLSISDNTMLKGGQAFAKIWLIKNVGTCTWTDTYALRFFSGDKMNGPDQVELPQQVDPGETVEIHLNLVAPADTSASSSNWVLSDPQGTLFGFGANGDQPISVIIQIKPTPKPTSG